MRLQDIDLADLGIGEASLFLGRGPRHLAFQEHVDGVVGQHPKPLALTDEARVGGYPSLQFDRRGAAGDAVQLAQRRPTLHCREALAQRGTHQGLVVRDHQIVRVAVARGIDDLRIIEDINLEIRLAQRGDTLREHRAEEEDDEGDAEGDRRDAIGAEPALGTIAPRESGAHPVLRLGGGLRPAATRTVHGTS